MAAATESEASRVRQWVWPLAAALVGALVYLNANSNGFALDDFRLVRDNPNLGPEVGIRALFGQPYWPGSAASGLYRPVTIASLALNRMLTGTAPAGFHVVNLLLHALVSGLVWYVVRGIGVHYGTALAAALLFAVHPLHTEVVANIAGRAELMAAVWVLSSPLTRFQSGIEFMWPPPNRDLPGYL